MGALGDDVLDVMLTLAANTPIVDGLARPRAHSPGFPVLWSGVYGAGAGRGDADPAPG
jgi:hypothetical protein